MKVIPGQIALTLVLVATLIGCDRTITEPNCATWHGNGSTWTSECGETEDEFYAANFPEGTTVTVNGATYYVVVVDDLTVIWKDLPIENPDDARAISASSFPVGSTLRFR